MRCFAPRASSSGRAGRPGRARCRRARWRSTRGSCNGNRSTPSAPQPRAAPAPMPSRWACSHSSSRRWRCPAKPERRSMRWSALVRSSRSRRRERRGPPWENAISTGCSGTSPMHRSAPRWRKRKRRSRKRSRPSPSPAMQRSTRRSPRSGCKAGRRSRSARTGSRSQIWHGSPSRRWTRPSRWERAPFRPHPCGTSASRPIDCGAPTCRGWRERHWPTRSSHPARPGRPCATSSRWWERRRRPDCESTRSRRPPKARGRWRCSSIRPPTSASPCGPRAVSRSSARPCTKGRAPSAAR